MTQYTKQDTIEENGINLFRGLLDPNFFLLNDFATSAGKDKYPNIDGQIRLRDGRGHYLNLYLHYQLKSTEDLQNEKYSCDKDILDYLISTNIPTLLIIADIKNQKVYWFFINDNQKKKLGLKEKDNSGKTLDLSSNIINSNEALQLNQTWQEIAREDDYTKLNNSVSKISNSFHEDIQKCLGLLYLLQRIPKNKLVELFNNLLQIEKSKIELIVQQLIKENVISVTTNFYILDNEQLGIESLYKLLEELNLVSLESIFNDKKDRIRILRQLAKIEHETVQKYLINLAGELLNFVKKPTNNDDTFINLELLEEYAFRIPVKALEIIKVVINAEPMAIIKTEYKGFGLIEGKSHYDLIKKCIEICNRIRYLEKEVFDILIDLSKQEDKIIKGEALRVLENICKYNLSVLKKIGYGVQIFIIEKIEKWGDKKLIENNDALIYICGELLESSFEEASIQDYKTLTFCSGALNPGADLKDIRRRAIEILKRLYSLIKDLTIQKKILTTLEEASRTPFSVNYGEDMKQMVIENTNALIEYYLLILPGADNEIIKDIEEQSHRFWKGFGNEKLPRLNELKTSIASKTEYDMFRVFVGQDREFDKDMNWDKARNFRNEKIQGFIKTITESNFLDWEKKINLVIKNYYTSDPGEFRYFNIFLYELSKQKPKFALLLIIKPNLEPFLIHIIAGIWNSSLQKEAKKLITKWTKLGKNLMVSAYLFDYVESVDEKLLNTIFNKAKKVKDIQALNNILRSIVKNYFKHKSLKDLFIRTIKELTKNNNYGWIHNVWYRGETIFNDFKEKDFDVILTNLLILPNIEYYAEEILKPVAVKYPEKIINFFYKRVLIKSKRDKNIEDRYDAVPFDLHEISTPLKQHEAIIIPMLLAWYNKGNSNNRWLFKWEASHLFEIIFSGFSPVLEQALVDMINNDQKRALKVVFSVLSKYKGQDFLWGVIRAVVEKYTSDKRYKKIEGILFGYLSQTGVVTGEYGFVNALQNKKHQIQQFNNDSSQAVKVFVRDFEQYLDQNMDYERKRADEEIKLMEKGADN